MANYNISSDFSDLLSMQTVWNSEEIEQSMQLNKLNIGFEFMESKASAVAQTGFLWLGFSASSGFSHITLKLLMR